MFQSSSAGASLCTVHGFVRQLDSFLRQCHGSSKQSLSSYSFFFRSLYLFRISCIFRCTAVKTIELNAIKFMVLLALVTHGSCNKRLYYIPGYNVSIRSTHIRVIIQGSINCFAGYTSEHLLDCKRSEINETHVTSGK